MLLRLPPTRFALTVAASTVVVVVLVGWLASLVFDHPPAQTGGVRALGPLGDLLGPLRQWDAGFYEGIAQDGYDRPQELAFFPLYPLLVAVLSLFGAAAWLEVLAGFAAAAGAYVAALVVFERLARLEVGEEAARRAVLLLAAFPAAMFFVAPYTEGLFLLLTVGSVYAGRTGHWAWAGALGGLAAMTRNTGVLLVVPLALLLWQQHRGPHRDALWLALIPAGLAAVLVMFAVVEGDPLAFLDAQSAWAREFWGPFGGVVAALIAGVEAVRELLGSPAIDRSLLDRNNATPAIAALQNLYLLGFLALGFAAVVGLWRRLPPAYAAYVLVGLAVPLSYPEQLQPLMSLPRFEAVLFPVFLWLALIWRPWVLPVSVAGLVAFTAAFATGRFVG